MNKTENLVWVKNPMKLENSELQDQSGVRSVMKRVRHFHQEFSRYGITPLVSLDKLAEKLGFRNIWVKDESKRFGLNAFKVLGGLYAMSRVLKETKDLPEGEKLLFVTATDGNHGRGVAWAAKTLGHNAVVFLPVGTAPSRLENIEKEGAVVHMLTVGYDDAVRHAAWYAQENGGILIQDTAWEGYDSIPGWIMEGYYTIMDEIAEQWSKGEWPTHVFLQAGVGSFPGSMTACIRALSVETGKPMPRILVMEPHNAACIYASVKAGTGEPLAAKGDLNTMMAGLACGEPNPISWNILRDEALGCLSCHDVLSALGMRILGNPLKGDVAVVSGESGAIGAGVLYALAKDETLSSIKEAIGLDHTSRILLISTEGDTDPGNYREVVWEGKGGSY